jgi:hypothetical protein
VTLSIAVIIRPANMPKGRNMKPTVPLIQIFTLEALARVRENKGAIVVPAWEGFKTPKPAAFVMNMTGDTIFRMIKDGLFVYSK